MTVFIKLVKSVFKVFQKGSTKMRILHHHSADILPYTRTRNYKHVLFN